MPTKLPRIYITLNPEVAEALDAFHAETGLARSQLLSQLLSESVPVINAMTDAFRLAKKSPAQAANAMRDVVQGAQIQLAQLHLDMAPKKRKKMRRAPKRD